MGIELPEIEAAEFADRLSACCEGLVTPLLIERLMIHYRHLRRWNRVVSLVGPTSRQEVVERHYGEALEALRLLPPRGGVLVDVGSGAGFPGFVLAAARADLSVTLVEARERKWAFLQTVCRKAGLSCRCLNARVAAAPVEDLPPEIDWITSRAVRLEDLGLPVLLPRLVTQGAMLLWSGVQDPDLPAGLSVLRQHRLAGSHSRRILEVGRRRSHPESR